MHHGPAAHPPPVYFLLSTSILSLSTIFIHCDWTSAHAAILVHINLAAVPFQRRFEPQCPMVPTSIHHDLLSPSRVIIDPIVKPHISIFYKLFYLEAGEREGEREGRREGHPPTSSKMPHATQASSGGEGGWVRWQFITTRGHGSDS
jgi:hypothetical protein